MSKLIRFIRDVSSHQLSVIRDDGLYRHLRFQTPGMIECYFDIVTWPGYLAVTGDMGTWTFSRTADMFEFFNGPNLRSRESFAINPGYWSEKFESGAGGSRADSPCLEFDGHAFDKGLQEWLTCYLEGCDDEDDAEAEKEAAKEAVRELTGNGFRRESDAYYALNDATFPGDVSCWDIFEGMGSLQKHSHHYLWICYAIVWGIERYNNQKLVARAMDTFLSLLPAHAAVRGVRK